MISSKIIITCLPKRPKKIVKEGKVLFGEDLSRKQCRIWYEQEKNAYFKTNKNAENEDPWYGYMRFVNWKLGFARIPKTNQKKFIFCVLGPGRGSEFDILMEKKMVKKIICIEASKNFRRILKKKGKKVIVIAPNATGKIKVKTNSCDVFLAFSVLHHIPKVSKVFSEARRILRPGGLFLVREPCSSMGIWATKRSATPNERGIPKSIILEYAKKNNFCNLYNPCPILFEPINKILQKINGYKILKNKILYFFDLVISRIFVINDNYWRNRWFQKLAPSSYFYFFKKMTKKDK